MHQRRVGAILGFLAGVFMTLGAIGQIVYWMGRP